jgi:anthranilate phosphoribosyltransferase
VSSLPAGPSWRSVLSSLISGVDLEPDAAAWAMGEVMEGRAGDAQIAGFAVALRAKGETPAEMTGLSRAMLEHAHRIEVPGPAVDVVGTGGDLADTVNISTMASLVVAGTGVTVVKHGNRSASSSTGTADVLEELGVVLTLTPAQVAAVAGTVGITFCFAQTFHPAMRYAAAARRELAVPTAFNFLGPLTNPAQPSAAAVGCADARMAPVMAAVFAGRGTSALVFRGDDGLDELTTTTTSTVWRTVGGAVLTETVDPTALGLPTVTPDALRGGDRVRNAAVVRDLVAGATGAVRDAVLLNAAAALVALGDPPPAGGLQDALGAQLATAAKALDDGAVSDVLDRWIAATQALAGG